MDPQAIFQQFVTEAVPVALEVAGTAALVGLVIGALLGGALLWGFRRLGWLTPEGKYARLTAAGVALASVGGTAAGGAAIVGGLGGYAGAQQAVRDSRLGEELLPALGALGADVVAQGVLVTAELTEADLDVDDGSLDAFRDGTWGLPVGAPDDAARALGPALDGPEGDALADRWVARVAEAVPLATRGTVRKGLRRLLDAHRAGADPRSLDPALGRAWSRLPLAAATDDLPATLSRDELSTAVVEQVLLPIGLRRVMVAVVPVVLGGLLVALAGWVVAFALVALVNRRARS